jgi:hypothetical protein
MSSLQTVVCEVDFEQASPRATETRRLVMALLLFPHRNGTYRNRAKKMKIRICGALGRVFLCLALPKI